MTWFNIGWSIANLVFFFVTCLVPVIGGLGRERGHKVMVGEVIRQLTGEDRAARVRKAKARELVDLEENAEVERARRARSRG